MRTTAYYREQVRRKRPYIRDAWCERVLSEPLRTTAQDDGRIRHWGYVGEAGKYLRVVTLDDGVTVHNAFFDRDFEP
jgi:hypothetical protein